MPYVVQSTRSGAPRAEAPVSFALNAGRRWAVGRVSVLHIDFSIVLLAAGARAGGRNWTWSPAKNQRWRRMRHLLRRTRRSNARIRPWKTTIATRRRRRRARGGLAAPAAPYALAWSAPTWTPSRGRCELGVCVWSVCLTPLTRGDPRWVPPSLAFPPSASPLSRAVAPVPPAALPRAFVRVAWGGPL